jgi:CBS domain-containing protein
MNVGDICTREVVLADRSASLQQAATLMREHHVGTLLVTADTGEGLQVAGVVTDRDLVIEAVARGFDVTQTEVGRFSNGKLAAIPATAAIDQAISMMKERGVRRLLVSGDQGQLYGVVSIDDVLGALGHEMAELAHAVRKGIDREAAERVPLRAAPQAHTLRIPPFAVT